MSFTHRLVDSPAELEDAVSDLEGTLDEMRDKNLPARLYLDTEFESNRSGTKLCLLQISAGKTSYLVDPLRLSKLDSLADVLEEEGVEWVLHAGLQDVVLICDALKVRRPEKLFDTQIAWGMVTAEASVSLAYLQFKILGIRAEKGHQADDWVRRPLQASQLRYAASDVDHLPKMTEELLKMARTPERAAIIFDASKDTLSPVKEPPAPLRLSSFRNAWQLSEKSQAGLRFLMEWYNGLPLEKRKHAPENKVLLSVAGRIPPDVGALSRIKGVSRGVVERYGSQLVAGIKSAVESSKSEDFVPIDPPAYATFDEIRLDSWLAQYRAHLSIHLSFAPELVLPSRLLKRMKAGLEAQGTEGLLESLVGWRRELLLDESEQFCRDLPPPLESDHAK